MSAALKPVPLPEDIVDLPVNGPLPRAPLPVLSRVAVTKDVVTMEGEDVPAGSSGTIVAMWDGGDLYDVEFGEAYGPATIAASLLRPL